MTYVIQVVFICQKCLGLPFGLEWNHRNHMKTHGSKSLPADSMEFCQSIIALVQALVIG